MTIAVIGAGVAGAAALLEASRGGDRVVVYDAGPAASALAGGCWDAAPLRPASSVADAVRDVAEFNPSHPYARLRERFDDPVAVAAEGDRLRDALDLFHPCPDRGVEVFLESGGTRRAATAQRSVLRRSAGVTVAVEFPTPRLAPPRPGTVAIQVDFFQRTRDSILSRAERARSLGQRTGFERFFSHLRRALGHLSFDALLLPAGTFRGSEGAARLVELTDRLGADVGEAAEQQTAFQSERLRVALDGVIAEEAAERIHRPVRRLQIVDGRPVLETRDGERTPYDAVVVAAGLFLSGAVAGPEGPLSFLPDVPWRGVSGRASAGGLEWDEHLRVLSDGGVPFCERVFAAGSVLFGVEPADGTGLGACAATGAIAGKAAAGG